MQQIWKTAWTCVPFTFIMFIHFYLVDVRHSQNHIVVCFLAIFWRSLYPRQPSSLTKGSAGTDQVMFFQITAAGTAPSINYSTENYRDWQKRHWFLVFHISIWGVEILFGGFSPEFWVPCYSVAPQLGGMYGGRLTRLSFLISREFRTKEYIY